MNNLKNHGKWFLVTHNMMILLHLNHIKNRIKIYKNFLNQIKKLFLKFDIIKSQVNVVSEMNKLK